MFRNLCASLLDFQFETFWDNCEISIIKILLKLKNFFIRIIIFSSIFSIPNRDALFHDMAVLNSLSKSLEKFHDPIQFVLLLCCLQIGISSRQNGVLISHYKFYKFCIQFQLYLDLFLLYICVLVSDHLLDTRYYKGLSRSILINDSSKSEIFRPRLNFKD